jgi:transcriptional regulator with AAA-type ATPase domain
MAHMTKAVILNEVKDLPPRVQTRLFKRAMSLVAKRRISAPKRLDPSRLHAVEALTAWRRAQDDICSIQFN